MHVFVGGIPAYELFSTDVWQYWHCRPSPSRWCLWLKGTGWSGRCPCRVTHGDRCNEFSATPSAMTIKPVSTRLARARAFELRSNTCAMNAFLLPLRQKTTVEVDISSFIGYCFSFYISSDHSSATNFIPEA